MTASFNPAAFKAILMGDESLTIACGDMLLAGGHALACVVTRDDSVRDWAAGHGIEVLRDPADLLRQDIRADWLLSIANLRMIPQKVLELPAKGAINFHDGPLPRYAGLNTPAWAIINGEERHGVTWHVIEGGVDEGDIVGQEIFAISPDETAFSLNSKCYAAGMESFGAILAQLEANALERRRQDLSQRSYFARDQRPDSMGFLDFRQSAEGLSALARGLDFGDYWNPLTTLKIGLGEDIFAVGRLTVLDGSADAGRVSAVDRGQLTVGTATRSVKLSRITTLDGKPVDLPEAFSIGDRLEAPSVSEIDTSDEPYWRTKLTAAELVTVPLAAPQHVEGSNALALSVPGASDLYACVAAAGLVLLKGAGVEEGIIGLVKAPSSPLMADWVPLALSAQPERPFGEVTRSIAEQTNRAQTSPGFLRDLPLRDFDLADDLRPEVAISRDGSRLPGAIVTVSFDDGGARLHYDSARLSTEAAKLLAQRLNAAFAAIPTARTCDEVWALPKSEEALLTTWNATDRSYDPHTIQAAFEAQVARAPEAEALVFEGESLTYAELNRRANRLAHVLIDSGAAPGTPIGLCTRRNTGLLVGALGILKAGGAYVPIDPAYPADRIAHYIADSAAPILVTEKGLVGDLPAHKAKIIALDADDRIAQAADTNPDPRSKPADLAYLIYTSGSTGTPKGVMVTHANVANFFAGMDDRIDHDADAVWLAVTSLSFDISVLELFWTLARGFKVVLAGGESRTMVSNGPIALSDRKMDFNLMYWGNDDGVGPKKYELLLEGAKFADAHGFNAIWTPERHFHAFGGPYPNPSVTGAAVAAVTRNLAVRAGSCVAPLHHPARIAEEWAVIDNLTNGRVGLAIASGWQPDDFVLRPENTPPENKPAMYRAIDQLRALWAGEAVAFPKQDGTTHAVVTQPRPVSERLPIWVTTAGNPQTWKEAGEIGANVLTHLLGQSIEEVAGKIEIYHQALRDAGHDPTDFTVTLMLHSYLAETREEAEEIARGPMKDYLRAAAALIKQYAWAFPAFKRPEGTTNAFDLDLEGLSDDELDAILEFAFQRYFNDSGMFGTVADGLARVEELKRIGVDEIACLIDYGIPPKVVMEGLKPLAEVLAQANQTRGLADDDFSLAAQIIRHKVTHLQCTPSMAQMLVTNDEARTALSTLDHILIGGEALPGSLVKSLRKATRAKLQNMYGPTETTIWSTSQVIEADVAATAPIGTPIANTQIFILDDKMGPQPLGVEGELWIGGDGVTPGYWHRDEVTAERFRDNPFGAGRLYRTGDLARFDAAGTLHFGGRADAQVKIRGHRIELGEIEARLATLADVGQAVVNAVEMQGSQQLVAYVVAQGTFDETRARVVLAKELPEIMLPAHFVVLERMPLTPNKKIDRKALPKPLARRTEADTPAAKKSDTQEAIAEIWKGLLGLSDIRSDDNFFALGGHSLLAVQAHRDIRSKLGADSLSITDIFRFPTLDRLAAHLDQGKSPKSATPTPEITAKKTETMSRRRAMRAERSKEGA
ncbi:MAG: LLM class flavin-dependent oxidoreductase [Sulfitobacter sp.]|nr:LLM class flavin-dependent oxidoreductase [Sulfitobacter sp.]